MLNRAWRDNSKLTLCVDFAHARSLMQASWLSLNRKILNSKLYTIKILHSSLFTLHLLLPLILFLRGDIFPVKLKRDDSLVKKKGS